MSPRLKAFITSNTATLAATYLAIIMIMSIGFSGVFYKTTSHELNRQVPPVEFVQNSYYGYNSQGGPATNTIRNYLSDRADEGRHELILRLLAVNLLALLVGAGVSCYLARRTLQPIEANMEAQRQFVSDASHELRTPLTAIQTSNDVALRNKKLSLADARAIIADNTAEVAKLKQLSDGLLDLARNDGSHQPLAPVNLQTAVQSSLNQIVTIAQAKNIAVDDTTAQLQVQSNEHILSQVLVILLDNAVKYSPEGSTIHVSSTAKGNYAFVHVKDEGVGIRASDIPHVFRRFYRADNARTAGNQNGYGLGLSIADNLAKTHNASLSVTSELHKGSTFTIKLPLVK